MEKDLIELYGSFSVPKEVHQLLKLEEDLQKEGLSLDMIGLIPIVVSYTYSIAPPDLIPFASTGGDGIHFGFLTDFNHVSDLMDAAIVCVTPTNDPPIRYIARNFREFLNLAVAVPYVEMLEGIWAIQTEEQLNEMMKEAVSDVPVDWEEKRRIIFNRLQQVFETQQVHILTYLHQMKMERVKRITMSTLDGLGVIGHGKGNSYSFATDQSSHEKEVERMNHFLEDANTIEKLAFIRDANYWYILTPDYDEAVWKLIIGLLESLDLKDETLRVSMRA